MNTTIIVSAVTAFIISGGGAIGVVAASGNVINKTVWTLAVIVGLISAAKDVRSQMSLPPAAEGDIPKKP